MFKNQITYYEDKFDVKYILKSLQTANDDAFEDPLYICDLSELVNRLKIWKTVLPKVAPYYSVKCNSYEPILKVLGKLQTGFDCASAGEIQMVDNLGVPGNRVVFANTTKKTSDILLARKRGVKRLVFDNECELLKIKKFYPDAELFLRIHADSKNVYVRMGRKYGAATNTEAFDLIEQAVSLDMKVVGISFHVGSGCEDLSIYVDKIAIARELFDFAAKLGMPMTVLNIGGGFVHDIFQFTQVAMPINQALNTYFPNNDVSIIAEPGRYFAAPVFNLVAKVINVKEIVIKGELCYSYTVNCGIHSGFFMVLYGCKFKKPQVLRDTDDKHYRSVLWGLSCDPNDKLFDKIYLPKLSLDDILIFKDMGAYSSALGSNFNGFKTPEIKPYINVIHKHLNPQTKTIPQSIPELPSNFNEGLM